jgi:uncharacterized protein YdaU (DUF1376 family)
MSRQRLRQSFIEWRSSLSINSSALKVIYLLKNHFNSLDRKINKAEVELNASVKDYINDNLTDDIESFKKNDFEVILNENTSLENDEIRIIKNNLKSNKRSTTSKKKKKASTTESTKTMKKKSTQTKKKTSRKTKLSEKRKSYSNSEEAKTKDDEIIEIVPLKEIKNKKTGWWSK